jgi:hypothetical protein
MKHVSIVFGLAAVLLTGCATSPKKFYADPAKPDTTSLCRAVFDQGAEETFRSDVARELERRGMTVQSCNQKVNAQNAVLAGAALIGITTAAVIACNNGSCPSGGGGGYYDDDVDCYGGTGNGPRWQYVPIYVGSYDPYRLDADGDGTGCEASDISYGS